MNSAVTFAIAVWLFLMAATIASAWGMSAVGINATTATVSVMLISAIKVALIMAYFMELRSAPRPWQFANGLWLIGTASVVIGIYLY